MNLNLDTVILFFFGASLVLCFIIYAILTRNILGMVLRKEKYRIIPITECPQYIKDFYKTKEEELIQLGFKFVRCIQSSGILEREIPEIFAFNYYHVEKKTHALLSRSESGVTLFQVLFETRFANARKVITFDYRNLYLPIFSSDTINNDAKSTSLERQFEAHLRKVNEVINTEGPIAEFNTLESEEEVITELEESNGKYIDGLERKKFIKRLDEHNYIFTFCRALYLANKMFLSLLFFSKVRKELDKERRINPSKYELPVEIEIANFLNMRGLMNRPSKNKAGNFLLLFVSMILFLGAFGFLFSFDYAIILVVVVLIHEIGHLAAMKIFGYRNLGMLFIPFLGAMAMGTDDHIPAYKKVISYFSGPVPGIILGFLFLTIWNNPLSTYIYPGYLDPFRIGLILLVFNYFNLLPVLPLDGGQILNTIIFSRYTSLQYMFYSFSFIVLFALGFYIEQPILILVGIISIIGISGLKTKRRIIKEIQDNLPYHELEDEKNVLKQIFLILKKPPYNYYPLKKKFTLVQGIRSIMNSPKASLTTIFATLAIYIALIAVPIFIFWGPSLPGLSFFNSAPANLPCETVMQYAPPPGTVLKVDKSDFQRMPYTIISNPHPILEWCFYLRKPQEAGKPFKIDESAQEKHPGAFIARLFTLFGPPDSGTTDLSYAIMDKKTQIKFIAYYYNGTPAFIPVDSEEKEYLPVLFRFEELLKHTPISDCSYTLELKELSFLVGASQGKPFFDVISTIDKTRRSRSAIKFDNPVSVPIDDIDNMIFVYRTFVAVGHDRWIASENSMSNLNVIVSKLPPNLSKEQQLELFPILNQLSKENGEEKNQDIIKETRVPHVGMMQSAYYNDPEHSQIYLMEGSLYTQDGHRPLVHYLKRENMNVEVSSYKLDIDLEFIPGDTEDFDFNKSLRDYSFHISGNLFPDRIEIASIVGPVDTVEKINSWMEAARFFTPFQKIGDREYSFTLTDDSEAQNVRDLFFETTGARSGVTVNGKVITADKGRAYELGIIIAFVRYSNSIVGEYLFSVK